MCQNDVLPHLLRAEGKVAALRCVGLGVPEAAGVGAAAGVDGDGAGFDALDYEAWGWAVHYLGACGGEGGADVCDEVLCGEEGSLGAVGGKGDLVGLPESDLGDFARGVFFEAGSEPGRRVSGWFGKLVGGQWKCG